MSEAEPDHHADASNAYRIKLGEKPCAVKFVESFGGFVVGTYDCLADLASARQRFPELDEEKIAEIYEETNHRIGSLYFFAPTSDGNDDPIYRLQIEHRCKHGGIFDMSLVQDERIYAAHANGHLARYSFDNSEFQNLDSIKVAQSNGALLTSIDTCSFGDRPPEANLLALVGDSLGRVTLVSATASSSFQVVASCDITADANPVWQVKFLPRDGTASSGRVVLILAAAEDSSWYIFRVENVEGATSAATFQRLHRNQDFQAGVTSICFLPTPCQDGDPRQIRLLLGSYDESIRHYKLSIDDWGNDSADRGAASIKVKSQLESLISIAGGGIWRLNRVDSELYIAAMYAGAYRLDIDALCQPAGQSIECQRLAIDVASTESDEGGMAPLHYGIDLSPRHSLACVVDYNNNCCIFVRL